MHQPVAANLPWHGSSAPKDIAELPHVRAAAAGTMEVDRPVVAVVGLGYVGAPTAVSLAHKGFQVLGIDASPNRLARLRAAQIDAAQSDLDQLRAALDDGRLELHQGPDVLERAEAVVICVPTPIDEHLSPDLTALRSVCATVVEHAQPNQTIVLTSTTYVGCTRDLLVTPLEARGFTVGRDVHVCFSPERINPGDAAHAPVQTPRIIGGVTPECLALGTAYIEGTCLHTHAVSSAEAAEMTKLHENTYRAVNIAFANEMATVCGSLGIDVVEVIEAAATKPYGFTPFYPGPGVGGHCIPCDPHYLLWQLRRDRVSAPVIDSAMTAIAHRPRQVVGRLRDELAEQGRALRGSRVLVVGVTYKPGVEDVRESPAIEIINALQDLGVDVAFTDGMVRTVTTHRGTLEGLLGPKPADFDAVLVTMLHPGTSLAAYEEHPCVIDATYRARDLAGARTV